MGKIMKDGIQYGVGGIQKAEGITYDNTDSGMTATNVQGAIDELNSNLTVQTGTDGSVTWYKFGNVVTVKVFAYTALSQANAWVQVGTVPSNCHPNAQVSFVCYDNGVNASSVQYTAMSASVRANGTVHVYPYRTSSVPYGTVTYIVD